MIMLYHKVIEHLEFVAHFIEDSSHQTVIEHPVIINVQINGCVYRQK